MRRDHVQSSNLHSVGYDPEGKTLEIEFRSGAVYQYKDVPLNIYRALMAASSKGKYFNSYIRDSYQTDKCKME